MTEFAEMLAVARVTSVAHLKALSGKEPSLQVLIKTLTDENELNPVEQITFANLLRKERN